MKPRGNWHHNYSLILVKYKNKPRHCPCFIIPQGPCCTMRGFVCAFTFYSIGRPKSCPFHLTHHQWQVVQTEVIHHGCNQYMMGALTCQPHSCLLLAHANAVSSARPQHRKRRQISSPVGGIAIHNFRYLLKGLTGGSVEVFISLLLQVNCWTITIYNLKLSSLVF